MAPKKTTKTKVTATKKKLVKKIEDLDKFCQKNLLGNFKKIVNLYLSCSVFDLIQGGSNSRYLYYPLKEVVQISIYLLAGITGGAF